MNPVRPRSNPRPPQPQQRPQQAQQGHGSPIPQRPPFQQQQQYQQQQQQQQRQFYPSNPIASQPPVQQQQQQYNVPVNGGYQTGIEIENAGYSKDYFEEFQSSASGQIGMQLGTQALSQAQQQFSSNVDRYFNITQWRYYFNVSNSYVLNKLQLLIFPFLHKSWSRSVEQTNMQDIVEYSPPRSDLNAPDLYIPVMSFVTYIIIIGVVAGLAKKNSFSPDVLGLTASKAFFLVLFEVLFVKLGNYFLNISSDAPFLELFAYMGYKFIPINTVLIAKIFSTSLVNTMVFIYCFFAFGFFTLRSLRGVIIPESGESMVNQVPGSARKRRVAYLFIIVALQTFVSWILV